MFNLLPVLTSILGQNVSIDAVIAAAVVVVVGVIIIMIVGALLFFLPAVVIAGVVWYITGNTLYAAVAFLIVAVLSLIRRK